jgi:hypothetical protein
MPNETPSSQQPLVSVIVLNYNGMRFLETCYSSLMKTTYQNVAWIMVDNASADESVDFIRRNFPLVTIIQSGENAGFSRGNNIGIRAAKGKYVVLLNNDVRVDPGWLSPLVEAAESDDSIAALQPKIRSMIDEGYFEYAGAAGGMIDKYGYPFLRGRVFDVIEKDNGQYDYSCDIFWASGAAMFLRADVLKQTGLLDDDFIYHMEEIDLCWRIHLAGYKIKSIPQGVIYHFAGGTLPTGSYRKLYLNHRNNLFMMLKNLHWASILRRMSVRFILEGINAAVALIKLDWIWLRAIITAHAWFWTHLPLMIRKRKTVQNQRRVDDKTVFDAMYPRSLVFDYFLRKKRTYTELQDKLKTKL